MPLRSTEITRNYANVPQKSLKRRSSQIQPNNITKLKSAKEIIQILCAPTSLAVSHYSFKSLNLKSHFTVSRK